MMRWAVPRTSFLLLSFLLLSVCPSLAETAEEEDGVQEEVIPSARPQSKLFRILGSTLYVTSAADFGTTEWGLRRPDLQEGNPLASNRAVRASSHVLGPAAVYWTTEKLHASGRHKLALILRIGVTAAYGYAAIHNLRKVSASPTP